MKTMVRGRQCGKTTELIRLCAAHPNSRIVCLHYREAQRILQQAENMGCDIPVPITFDSFRRGDYRGMAISAFYFDNAELFLQSMTHVPIAAMTVSDE